MRRAERERATTMEQGMDHSETLEMVVVEEMVVIEEMLDRFEARHELQMEERKEVVCESMDGMRHEEGSEGAI
jgi:hypothetical protein